MSQISSPCSEGAARCSVCVYNIWNLSDSLFFLSFPIRPSSSFACETHIKTVAFGSELSLFSTSNAPSVSPSPNQAAGIHQQTQRRTQFRVSDKSQLLELWCEGNEEPVVWILWNVCFIQSEKSVKVAQEKQPRSKQTEQMLSKTR